MCRLQTVVKLAVCIAPTSDRDCFKGDSCSVNAKAPLNLGSIDRYTHRPKFLPLFNRRARARWACALMQSHPEVIVEASLPRSLSLEHPAYIPISLVLTINYRARARWASALMQSHQAPEARTSKAHGTTLAQYTRVSMTSKYLDTWNQAHLLLA